MEAANRLFAQKGYEGASIRDIAGAADVNVAAVNYHFNSKQCLYHEVSLQSQQWLEENIAIQAKEAKSTEDLVLRIFDFLNQDAQYLKNAFLMYLSDSVPEIDDEQMKKMMELKGDFGPPGGEWFFKLITQEVGEKVPSEARRWAVKSIFSQLLHWTMVINTKHCSELYKDHPDFQPEAKRKFLSHCVQSALNYISKEWL